MFLINHNIIYNKLFEFHHNIVNTIYNFIPENFLIGVNCLDLKPYEIFRELDYPGTDKHSYPMIWTDNYNPRVPVYEKQLCEDTLDIISKYVDVVITSCEATGVAADPEKLKRMKSVLGNKELAIASGITVENVLDYAETVDIFLVASSISKDFYNLDFEKTKELSDKIRNIVI